MIRQKNCLSKKTCRGSLQRVLSQVVRKELFLEAADQESFAPYEWVTILRQPALSMSTPCW